MDNDWNIEEKMDLHKDIERFVDRFVAPMPNNGNAQVLDFIKCDGSGPFFVAPVRNCNNTDFFEVNKLAEQRYGAGSRLASENRADGNGCIVRFIVALPRRKPSPSSSGFFAKGGAGGKSDRPTFQGLTTLLLLDIVLMGALYWKTVLAATAAVG